MSIEAETILSVLDRCRGEFTIPMLDNGYVYLAATRLSLYCIFDSADYRNLHAKWLFPQEKVALDDLKMATCESKML